MKLIGFSVVWVLTFAGVASGEIVANQNSSGRRALLCDSWNYSSEAWGYVCSHYPSSSDLVEQYDFNQAVSKIRELESELSDLKERVKQLEARP